MSNAKGKTSMGIEPNIAGLLCYLGWWITAIIFLILEKDNEFVRFHAMQSIITFGILTLLSFVPLVGWILSPLIMIAGFVLWLLLIFKAYQGEKFKLPVVGDFAEKQLARIK